MTVVMNRSRRIVLLAATAATALLFASFGSATTATSTTSPLSRETKPLKSSSLNCSPETARSFSGTRVGTAVVKTYPGKVSVTVSAKLAKGSYVLRVVELSMFDDTKVVDGCGGTNTPFTSKGSSYISTVTGSFALSPGLHLVQAYVVRASDLTKSIATTQADAVYILAA